MYNFVVLKQDVCQLSTDSRFLGASHIVHSSTLFSSEQAALAWSLSSISFSLQTTEYDGTNDVTNPCMNLDVPSNVNSTREARLARCSCHLMFREFYRACHLLFSYRRIRRAFFAMTPSSPGMEGSHENDTQAVHSASGSPVSTARARPRTAMRRGSIDRVQDPGAISSPPTQYKLSRAQTSPEKPGTDVHERQDAASPVKHDFWLSSSNNDSDDEDSATQRQAKRYVRETRHIGW